MIQPPSPGEPVDELWKKVAEIVAVVNALSTLTVTGAQKGKIVMSGAAAVIVLQQN